MFFQKNKKLIIVLIIALLFLGAILLFFEVLEKGSEVEDYPDEKIEQKHYPAPEKDPEPAPSMDILKEQGCVTDGVLYGYEGNVDDAIDLVNRSGCKYLHRAVETWLSPPDFWEVALRKDKLEAGDMVIGMFIAEAIDKKSNYYYLDEDRDFDFSKMCRKGSDNYWGEHTCKPSFERSEYRKYLRYITEQAIDQGVRVFLFGQIFYQEKSDLNNPVAKAIIGEMKEYAAFKGVSILVGAQTNSIQDEDYLKLFDFIEGGVGLSEDGTIEDGPCFSRWWNEEDGGWCWALLWHKNYAKKANDVLIHLDWSGKMGDDMSIFARMSQKKRAETLKYLYEYFKKKDIGFLLPVIATLPKDNGGCYGNKKKYYSANNKYSCQDEDIIEEILKSQ